MRGQQGARQAEAKRWLQTLHGLSDEEKVAAWERLKAQDPQLASYLSHLKEQVKRADARRARALGGDAALISAGAGARLEQIADLVSAQRGSEQAALFEALRERVPAFAAALREALFSFDKLRYADAKGIQKLIAQVERRRLIVALRGADGEVAEAFYRQLSRRAAAELQEEIGLLGPTRKSEVESAQREIASLAESLQRAGELLIIDPKQGDEWVT